jgi:hypothetical protein
MAETNRPQSSTPSPSPFKDHLSLCNNNLLRRKRKPRRERVQSIMFFPTYLILTDYRRLVLRFLDIRNDNNWRFDSNFLSSHENLLFKTFYGLTMLPATQPRNLRITDTLDYCQRTCAVSVSALPCLARTNLFHPARTKGNLSHRAVFIKQEIVVSILSQRVGWGQV